MQAEHNGEENAIQLDEGLEMLLLTTHQIIVEQNEWDNLDEQEAARVAPDDDHDYSIDGGRSLPGRRAEHFAKVGEDVGEVVQVGHDGTEGHAIAEDVAEVKAIRCQVMYQHLFVVRAMLVKELVLNEVAKVEPKGVQTVIQ